MKNLFKSILSNQAVLDSRKTKWYIVLVMFVLNMFIPWIPALTKGYQTNGAAFLNASTNNEIEKGFKSLLNKDYFKNITIEQNADGSYYLDYSALENEEYFSAENGGYVNEYNGTNTKELYRDSYTNSDTNETHTYFYDVISVEADAIATKTTAATSSTTDYENNGRNTYLQAYFFTDKDITTPWLSSFVMKVILNYDKQNKPQNYPHSYALFNTGDVRVVSYPLKAAKVSTQASTSYYGSVSTGFKNVETGTKLGAYLFEGNGTTETAMTNFTTFLYNANRPSNIVATWYNCLYLSIFAFGAMIVASLVLLFLNKRKTSIYRDTNYWECIKEAVILCFTPAVIAMAIGFMNFTYGVVAIIGAALIRVVWMSSKICPPAVQGSNDKPLYQARS